MNELIDLSGPWRAIVRAPMIRIAVPFLAGIVLATWLSPPAGHVGMVFALLSPAAFLVVWSRSGRNGRWKLGMVVPFWFLSAGMWWQVLMVPEAHPQHIAHRTDHDGPWALRITAVNGSSERVLRAEAELVAQVRLGAEAPAKGSVLLTLLPGPGKQWPTNGERLLVDAPLAPITRVPDPGGFDRRAWAASRGIGMELFAPAGSWRSVDRSRQWTDVFSELRSAVATWLEGSALPVRERALVKALVLGQRDELDGDQRESFARSGTVHVLAVSGMHVGLIFAILTFMFGWWGGGPHARLWRGVLILLALWGYAGLTGASPSVLRATIMFSLFTVAGMMAQRTDHLNSLFAAGFLLLLWEPRMVVQISFQLSFLAVLGIILFYKPLEHLWMPKSRLLRGVWSLAVVSISAQVLVTPISLYLFKAFPVWFLPANIVVVTAVGLAVNGAVALLLLYKVPYLGAAITWAMTTLLGGVGLATDLFATLPGAYPDIRIGRLDVALLYLLVLGLGAWSIWRWGSMRWVAAMAMAMLLLSWGHTAHVGREERMAFTVYDERARSVAAITTGRRFTLLCHPDTFAADPWLQRKVDRHRRREGLDQPAFLEPRTLYGDLPQQRGATLAGGGRWQAPGFDVAFHTGSGDWRHGPRERKLDAVVVHGVDRLDMPTLQAIAASSECIVLGADLGWRARRSIQAWCSEQGMLVHDVREQGAFVLLR